MGNKDKLTICQPLPKEIKERILKEAEEWKKIKPPQTTKEMKMIKVE